MNNDELKVAIKTSAPTAEPPRAFLSKAKEAKRVRNAPSQVPAQAMATAPAMAPSPAPCAPCAPSAPTQNSGQLVEWTNVVEDVPYEYICMDQELDPQRSQRRGCSRKGRRRLWRQRPQHLCIRRFGASEAMRLFRLSFSVEGGESADKAGASMSALLLVEELQVPGLSTTLAAI